MFECASRSKSLRENDRKSKVKDRSSEVSSSTDSGIDDANCSVWSDSRASTLFVVSDEVRATLPNVTPKKQSIMNEIRQSLIN